MNETAIFYNKAKSNTIIAVGSTGISILLSTAITPLLILSLGTENWARYAFFLLYVAALSFLEAALQNYSLQANAAANSAGITYSWQFDRQLKHVVLGSILIGIIAIIFNYIFNFINDRQMQHLLCLAIVNIFPRSIGAILKGNLLTNNCQRQYYIVTTIFNVARPLFLLFCLTILSRSVLMLAMLYVVFSVSEMIFLVLVFRSNREVARPVVEFIVERRLLYSLIFANLLSTISTNLDKIFAYGFLTLQLVGEYAFSSQIAALLYLFINAAVAAFSPKFRELWVRKNSNEIRSTFYLLSAINNLLISTAVVFFVANADFLLVLFSTKIDKAGLVYTFILISIAVFISSNLWIPSAIATSSGKAQFSIYTNLIFMSAYAISFWLLYGKVDHSIFAIAMLCASGLTTVIGLGFFGTRVLTFSIWQYLFASVLAPLSVALVTYYYPAFLIKREFNSLPHSVFFAIFWLVCISSVIMQNKIFLRRWLVSSSN